MLAHPILRQLPIEIILSILHDVLPDLRALQSHPPYPTQTSPVTKINYQIKGGVSSLFVYLISHFLLPTKESSKERLPAR